MVFIYEIPILSGKRKKHLLRARALSYPFMVKNTIILSRIVPEISEAVSGTIYIPYLLVMPPLQEMASLPHKILTD